MPAPAIVGHKKQLLHLAQDLQSGNVAHAYLFAGAPHIGKTTVAHWFARQILLQDASEEKREEVSKQMDRLIHPDLLVLDQLWIEDTFEDWEAVGKSSNLPQLHRSKDRPMRTDTISIDDVRAMQERLQETGELLHRVCIIRSIERMQEAAASAFLKMLEEPPAGRIFLLTTESLSSLLPTITSRTRMMRFERVGNRELQLLLADLPEEDQSFIVHVAQGAPGTALRLKEDSDALRKEKLAHTQAAALWNSTLLHDRLKLLTPLLERGPEADRFLFHLSLALREVPGFGAVQERALSKLAQSLKTNVYRPLIVERFAVQVAQ